MALSSCPKCGQHNFELKENSPRGSAYKLMFVQCSACGTVVGATEYYNAGAMLEKQNAALKKIASQLNVYVDLD